MRLRVMYAYARYPGVGDNRNNLLQNRIHMNISYIIPVLNGEKYIRDCIESILQEMTASDEIIVVDNGSTDSTGEIVAGYPYIKLLTYPRITISALRNRGAHIAAGDLLAFVDADCILCDGWRSHVIGTFTDSPVAAAGSRYDLPENPVWIEKAWFSQKTRQTGPAKYINAGNLVVRKEVFIRIEGFDESLVTDEDYEFGMRLNRAGYSMLEVPAIRVIHLGNAKTLRDFYAKESWHATSMLATQSLSAIDRPTLMTMVHGIALVISVIAIPAAILDSIAWLYLLSLILFVPGVTAIYRTLQYGCIRSLPALVLLYEIYYMVRLKILIAQSRGSR